MTCASIIFWIGLSHLLQPPLAFVLTRRLALRAALAASPPQLGQVLQNMAIASITLPTALGVLLALHAQEVPAPGPARSLAWLLSAFWCWRLVRQIQARSSFRASAGLALHLALTAIFLLQGPGLALLLAVARGAQRA